MRHNDFWQTRVRFQRTNAREKKKKKSTQKGDIRGGTARREMRVRRQGIRQRASSRARSTSVQTSGAGHGSAPNVRRPPAWPLPRCAPHSHCEGESSVSAFTTHDTVAATYPDSSVGAGAGGATLAGCARALGAAGEAVLGGARVAAAEAGVGRRSGIWPHVPAGLPVTCGWLSRTTGE